MEKNIEGNLNVRKLVDKNKAHKKEIAHYAKNWKYEMEEDDELTFETEEDSDEEI
jgi:hypothetical protein